ncbi:MAG: hypothetical protein ABI217_04050 [Chthoniobacterales bacterium]
MKRSTIYLRLMLGAALLSLLACQRIKPALENPTPSDQQRQAARAAEAPGSTQQQLTYLNRIRQDDTLNSLISRTLLNDQNELGVVLFENVTPAEIPAIMRKVMTKMAQEFPETDVTLDVFTSATPLQKTGVAHLNGQTEEVTYTPKK